jgi:hypothetical protein
MGRVARSSTDVLYGPLTPKGNTRLGGARRKETLRELQLPASPDGGGGRSKA